MFVVIKSETVAKDEKGKFKKSVIVCPHCRKQTIKRTGSGTAWTSYSCWSCEGSFYVVDVVVPSAKEAKKCPKCDQPIAWEFPASDECVVSSCQNATCDQFGVSSSYDPATRSWFRGVRLTKVPKKYLIWWIAREPTACDTTAIRTAMTTLGYDLMPKTRKMWLDFRKILNESVSYHVKINKKYWGLGIDVHLDLSLHSKQGAFNDECDRVVTKLRDALRTLEYGKCFVLPAQQAELNAYLEAKYKANRSVIPHAFE